MEKKEFDTESFESLNYKGQGYSLLNQQSSADVLKDLKNWTSWQGEAYPVFEAPLRGQDERWLNPIYRGEKVLRSYKSAQSFDEKAYISREDFFAVLDKTLPRANRYPFQGLGCATKGSFIGFCDEGGNLGAGFVYSFS